MAGEREGERERVEQVCVEARVRPLLTRSLSLLPVRLHAPMDAPRAPPTDAPVMTRLAHRVSTIFLEKCVCVVFFFGDANRTGIARSARARGCRGGGTRAVRWYGVAEEAAGHTGPRVCVRLCVRRAKTRCGEEGKRKKEKMSALAKEKTLQFHFRAPRRACDGAWPPPPASRTQGSPAASTTWRHALQNQEQGVCVRRERRGGGARSPAPLLMRCLSPATPRSLSPLSAPPGRPDRRGGGAAEAGGRHAGPHPQPGSERREEKRERKRGEREGRDAGLPRPGRSLSSPTTPTSPPRRLSSLCLSLRQFEETIFQQVLDRLLPPEGGQGPVAANTQGRRAGRRE